MLLKLQHAAAAAGGCLHLTLCPTMPSAGTVMSLEQRKNNHLTVFAAYLSPARGRYRLRRMVASTHRQPIIDNVSLKVFQVSYFR